MKLCANDCTTVIKSTSVQRTMRKNFLPASTFSRNPSGPLVTILQYILPCSKSLIRGN
ncbi:p6.3 [Trichoplusia ni granulovirus LBIV-12]|uniref:p6.3 n=2 Tax=Trichoplusia ni granulosis virus TaxID=10462 RepID=A0A1D8QLB6_GVTN|nr:p6.3 [Trichoplusia ni granulovirus LBIV-12]AAC40848.1 p6.3 [Trichoplusia ni granulovirus]AOW41431.1 p6.3 [Trichoplusia ni granulovirus LBIV-12]